LQESVQPPPHLATTLGFRKASPQYRPAIDGLRAIAVLAVFVFHLNRRWLPGGFVGVDVFFVISGYLITSILLREFEHDSFTLAKFYQRRIARLFPAFFTVALATLIGAVLIYSPENLASCGANLTAVTLSIANLKFMTQGNYFKLSPDAQPFLHFWSLSVEEQFYLLFPATLLFLYLKSHRHIPAILSALFAISFLACVALTRTKPVYAFYLLPTRAWELLAGSILANLHRNKPHRQTHRMIPLLGLTLIAASFFIIRESASFPGFEALLPVLGTVLLIGPSPVSNQNKTGHAERLLAFAPLVILGQMSYSLYLVHWPIFSFIDYKLYLSSPFVRVGLKITLSLSATAFSFLIIENPGRRFLNKPTRRPLAFTFLAAGVLICAPLGIHIKNQNYMSSDLQDVARGGLAFNQNATNGSIILMGDSHGWMYGETIRQIATQLGYRLNVISAAATDPLPHTAGQPSALWSDSLATVKRRHPTYLILVCNWTEKLTDDPARLTLAVSQLRQFTDHLILLTQPPVLPDAASRESMRNGTRPPFFEDPTECAARTKANALVQSQAGNNVTVINVEPHFTAPDGSLRFADNAGNEYYRDPSHLSGYGADLLKQDISKELTNQTK
jgi:peptidoglycan/LPS O-acetylase OafA/YrhL